MPYASSTTKQVVQLGLINAYVVLEDDGVTVIDALNPKGESRILAAAEALGAPIKRIVLTHAHPDHVGSLDALVAAVPGVEVITSGREAKLLAGDRSLEPGEPADGKFLGKPLAITTRATRTVEDGDTVGSLRVIASPGHSPGHVAFLDERDGTLFGGDVYSTIGRVATTAGPDLRFPLPGFVTWSRPIELESAKKLRALDAQRLAPGHGKVVESPGTAMDRAIARKS
jgi:glyoxylase-like metal-dependent hydrolase (beta-lactamase superfamily II)